MKLFVWDEFEPDWWGGLAFALAENEEQAKELVIKTKGWKIEDWGKLSVYELDAPVVRALTGTG